MKKIYLEFPFLEECILKVEADKDLLNMIVEYYKYYYRENIDENKYKHIEKLMVRQISDEILEVECSCYKENPKLYPIKNLLKLLTDIIDDFWNEKIKKIKDDNVVFIHASGILSEGKPIVFIGKTHSGKSTAVLKLLHMLDESGFISDDTIKLKRYGSRLFIEPVSFPLHVRLNSLVFNHLFHTEAMDDTQFYISSTVLKPEIKLPIPIDVLFSIEYGNENSCTEIEGIDKVHNFLGNEKNISIKILEVLKSIKLFHIKYRDDAFLLYSVQSILKLKKKNLIKKTLIETTSMGIRKGIVNSLCVQGNSMLPTLQHGQKVTIEHPNVNEIEISDIIVFYKRGRMVIHRVTDIRLKNGKRIFRTKGDNNPQPDVHVVFENEILGRVYEKQERE